MLVTVFLFVDVATGTLLDLAEGANTAQVHSGTKQAESDPFTVHNHAAENNNTVWVRQESGWPVSFSCSGSIRWFAVMYCYIPVLPKRLYSMGLLLPH